MDRLEEREKEYLALIEELRAQNELLRETLARAGIAISDQITPPR
ncbi:hypothetical protein [Asaia platycodi]|nr:hypothetical protein [Asaia platycodi]